MSPSSLGSHFSATFPCLMLVTDRKLAGGVDALAAAVDAAIAGGVNAVQLREKDLPPDQLLALALRLREVTRGRAVLLVNGSPEVALACDVGGVHLPQAAPMVERPQPRFVIGRSAHSAEAAACAAAEGVDYIVAGPVYETRSHPGSPASGLGLIESVTRAITLPVLAIGGITSGRVGDAMGAGASGVAVISAILAERSPGVAARELWDALEVAWLYKKDAVR